MKKILAFIFAAAMTFSLSACGNNNSSSTTSGSSSQSSSSSSSSSTTSNGTTTLANGGTLNVNNDTVTLYKEESGVKIETIYTFTGDTLNGLKMKLSIDSNQEETIKEAFNVLKNQFESQGLITEENTDSTFVAKASDSQMETIKKQYPSKEVLINSIKNSSSSATSTN